MSIVRCNDICIDALTEASNLRFDLSSPNKKLLETVLSFDVDSLESVSDIQLSKFIIVLSQYLISIKFRENELRVERLSIDKGLERRVMFMISSKQWKAGITLKEKIGVITEENEDIKKLSSTLDVIDGQLTIIDGMYEAFVELINAYKREQYRRSGSAVGH